MRINSDFITDSSDVSVDILEAVKRAIISGLRRKRYERPVEEHLDPSEKKLSEVATSSHEIMFKARTVFPLDLFPDTVVVDREKLTIAQRLFFFTAKVISVPIRDILSVEVDVGPFFGSLKLTSRYFFTNPQSIRFLWRSQAIGLQRLLQGYIIAHERGIECESISKPHLERLLLDLGRGDIK